jgi:cytochrome c oxidase accessory protein FixG
MSDPSARKIIPITVQSAPKGGPAEPGPAMHSLYEAQKKIYPRSVAGLFTRWRWVMVALTQLVYYGLPWLEWGQRQAVLFDLGTRRFYIFGLVLYPQDFIYLTGLLVISALSLFLFTAVAGRLWCGYTCPQTVYTEIFLWIEHKLEGDRMARMRLDAAPPSANKLLRKGSKHFVWIALSLWTGFTFVGYFSPIRALGTEFLHAQVTSWEVFWTFFYGFATYGAAGFMREQVCKYMCPYARFQSAMFDRDTLIVTYDTARGEPRGRRARSADPATLDLGACIDCTLCVQVCPTGIDIRKGLQYECIGCGACVDVCDTVMDKMGYARGLIKYSTENAIEQRWSRTQIWRRVLRPRVLVYSAILAAISLAVVFNLAMRTPFRVDVVRDRGTLARVVNGGLVENVYQLQIMNATESAQRYRITATGLPGLSVVTDDTVMVDATQSRWVALRLQLPPDAAPAGSHPIRLAIEALDSPGRLVEKSAFLVPR